MTELEILLARGYGRSDLYYKEYSKLIEENYQLKIKLADKIDDINPFINQ